MPKDKPTKKPTAKKSISIEQKCDELLLEVERLEKKLRVKSKSNEGLLAQLAEAKSATKKAEKSAERWEWKYVELKDKRAVRKQKALRGYCEKVVKKLRLEGYQESLDVADFLEKRMTVWGAQGRVAEEVAPRLKFVSGA